MTNLAKLNVSLTKHGAHKLALLLRRFDKDHILDNLWGKVPGINVESAQAKKNLSVSRSGVVPELWNEVRALGNEAINALVLVALIFSHYDLIAAMRNSTDKSPFKGTIDRDRQLKGKAYTNFAHTIHELGYSSENFYSDHIRFDVKKLFDIAGLNALVTKLLVLKLEAAGWKKDNSLLEEVAQNRFHEVFSITEDQFIHWLSAGSLERVEISPEDIEFFSDIPSVSAPKQFEFVPGHTIKKTGKVAVSPAKGECTADLVHNEIQNKLYSQLVNYYGEGVVATEVSTGTGTSIDVVVKTEEYCWFYEIKTASTVKACIRQAIPQLLEYAYWDGEIDRANKLIIVSPLPPTEEARRYLEFLSKNFNLPLGYEQFIDNPGDPGTTV